MIVWDRSKINASISLMRIANTKVMFFFSLLQGQFCREQNARRCVLNMKILDVNIGFTFEKKNLVHCTKVERGSVLRKEDHIVHELADADGWNVLICDERRSKTINCRQKPTLSPLNFTTFKCIVQSFSKSVIQTRETSTIDTQIYTQ